MSKVFFIADTHFGHTNMAIKRGFKTVEEHDELIVSNWNKVVTKRDVVYLLGDVTMEKASNYDILDRLKGTIKVVCGNHDKPQHIPRLLEHVSKVAGSIKWKDCILTHIPIHPMEIERFKLNIHGHIHEEKVMHFHSHKEIEHKYPDRRYICVSCEQINYTPIEILI